MSAGDVSGPNTTPPDEGAEPLVERIRDRAFQLSLGPESGTDDENWLRAEQLVLHESRIDELTRLKELEDAREAEASALLSAQVQAFGHP